MQFQNPVDNIKFRRVEQKRSNEDDITSNTSFSSRLPISADIFEMMLWLPRRPGVKISPKATKITWQNRYVGDLKS